MKGFRTYHSVVKHSICDWFPVAILCIKVLTDHLEMGILTHLVRVHQAKGHMASEKKDKIDFKPLYPGGPFHVGWVYLSF